MPFKSKAQQRFLFAREPEVAKRYAKEMSKADFAKLPEKIKPKKKGKMGSMLSALKRMGE